MKTEVEIQRAHDLLVGFLHLLNDAAKSEQGLLDDMNDVPLMMASADVLCWILGHENPKFAGNLVELEAMLFGKGIVVTDDGELCPDGDQEREG